MNVHAIYTTRILEQGARNFARRHTPFRVSVLLASGAPSYDVLCGGYSTAECWPHALRPTVRER